jgi:ABC-type transport system involved in multi-copper enzyme maturation permease subunit
MFAYTALTFPLVYLEPNTWPATVSVAGWTISGDDVLSAPAAGNLINGGMKLYAALEKDVELTTILPQLLKEFAIFHGLVIGGCLAWAMFRLRPLGIRHTSGDAPSRLRRRRRKNPPIGAWPMFWKEIFADPGPQLHWTLRVLAILLFIVSLIPALFTIAFQLSSYLWYHDWQNNSQEFAEKMNYWVQAQTGLVGVMMWLAVALRAAGSISGERARNTLDDLLITQLAIGEIVWGKWAGAICSVRRFALCLGLVFLLGICTGGLDPFGAILVALVWLTFAGFLAAIGLWFSTVCRSTQRATILTLLLTFLFLGGHWAVTWLFLFGPLTPLTADWVENPLRTLYGGCTPALVLAMSAYIDTPAQQTLHDSHMVFFDFGALMCLLFCLLTTPLILSLVRRRLAKQCNRASYPPRAELVSAWPETLSDTAQEYA